MYFVVPRANSRLNQPKNPEVCASFVSVRSKAHSAGVSVSATMPDSTTAMMIVSANCLNSSPVTPPMNATGTNTEQSTSTMATSAAPTCRIALSAARRGGNPSAAMMRSTFSITTIASSTTIPIANTRPNSVSTLIDMPSARNPRKVPTTLTGTASIGMIVARQLWRKRKTTSVTSTIASISVITTS